MKKLILFNHIILVLLLAKRIESHSFYILKSCIKHEQSLQQKDRNKGGIKNSLKDYGINLNVNFTNDFLKNISGGIKTGSAYIGLFKPNLKINFSKMFNWDLTGSPAIPIIRLELKSY